MYEPFYPDGSKEANLLVDILNLKIGSEIIYGQINMKVINIRKCNKFLASPYGISPFNRDFCLTLEYINDGEIKTKYMDKWQFINFFKDKLKESN